MIQDIEAEKGVLSGLYNFGKDCYIDIGPILNSGVFTNEIRKCIFSVLQECFKQTDKLDFPIFLSCAKKLSLDEFLLSNEETKTTLSSEVKIENVPLLAKKIAKLALARKGKSELREAMTQIEEVSGDESATKILSILEGPASKIQKILNSAENEQRLLGDGVSELIELLISSPNREIGISTGMPEYDRAIGGGLRRKGFALIGARRKIGKSSLAINIALFVAQKLKIPVLYLDTEMDNEQHLYRLLGNLTNIPISCIEHSKFTGNKGFVRDLRNAAKVLETLPITHQVVTGKSFDEILSIARRWSVKTVGYNEAGILNNCLIIYDYFKLMDPANLKHLKEYEAIGYQAIDLNNFCIEMDLPCLAFVQLNRELDIAQSDRLSWNCTSVCVFAEKTPEEIMEDGPQYGNRKIIFDVARFGGGLDKDNYINVDFNGELCQIRELSTAFDMKKEKEIGKAGFMVENDDVPF